MFIVTLILTRHLSAKEFGLVGMLSIFILIGQALVNSGFNQALIRQQDVDESDYSAVFFINLVFSLILYCCLFFLGPVIANFYNQPELVLLTRVLAVLLIINSFSYVQEARLTKNLEFKKLAVINLPSALVGAGVSVLLAFNNYGVWSIVALQLVTRFVYSVQIWLYSDWRPSLVFNIGRAQMLFSFGGKLAVAGIINTVYQNIYLVLIGRFFSVTQVGYYQAANNLVQYPVNTISMALQKVIFSAFSVIQDNNNKLKAGYKVVVQQTFFWVCPTFIIAGVVANPLFRFLFTEKWLPAAPYFQWLCVVGVLLPINSYNLSILNVKGRSDLFLKLEVLKKVVITIGLAATIPLGIKAMLIFQAVNSVFAYILNSYYSGKFIRYSIFDQIRDLLAVLGLAILVGVSIGLIDYYLFALYADWIRVFVGFFGGFGLYIILARLLRLSCFQNFVKIIQSLMCKP